jgi:hypothetical protein
LAELDVFKLLHRTPKQPKQARNLLDELLDQGVRAKPAARVICAADADDPLSCAAAIADRPALSRSAKKATPIDRLFEAEPKSAIPRNATIARRLPGADPEILLSPSARWTQKDQINGFWLISGGSGSGKSVLLRSLAQQFGAQVATVVFDFHGDLELPGFETVSLGERLGVNPLNQPGRSTEERARSFVSSVRVAVPSLGPVQALILSEATRAVLASGGGVRQLTEQLQQRREGKDRASVLGLLAALDSLFGDPVFQARIALSPAALLKGRTRLDLTKLVREAQVLCCDTLVRWLFTFLVQQGPAPNRQARAVVLIDEAALLSGSDSLDACFREARKFGLGLVLASQLARDFSPVLRANAGTLVALRAGSSAEARENARELGIEPAKVAALQQPGDALVKDSAGLRSVRIAPYPVEQPKPTPPVAEEKRRSKPVATATEEAAPAAKPTSDPSAFGDWMSHLFYDLGLPKTHKNGAWFLPGKRFPAFKIIDGELRAGRLDEHKEFVAETGPIKDPERYIRDAVAAATSEVKPTEPTPTNSSETDDDLRGPYTLSAKQAGELASFDGLRTASYDAKTVKRAIERVWWAAEKSSVRYNFTGAWTFGKHAIAATNGHVIAIAHTGIAWASRHRFTKAALDALTRLKQGDQIRVINADTLNQYTVHGTNHFSTEPNDGQVFDDNMLLHVLPFDEKAPRISVDRQQLIRAIEKQISWATSLGVKRADVSVFVTIPQAYGYGAESIGITSRVDRDGIKAVQRATAVKASDLVEGETYFDSLGFPGVAARKGSTITIAPDPNAPPGSFKDGIFRSPLKNSKAEFVPFRASKPIKAEHSTLISAGYLLPALTDTLKSARAVFVVTSPTDPIHFLEYDARVILMPVRQ